jgi:hypothetical protein
VLAGVAAGGCGGNGGSGGGGGGERLSRADYAAKADALCIKYNQKTKSIGQAKNLEEVAAAFDKALPILDNALADLRRLKPPANEQATADRWLAQSEVLQGDLTKMRERARANDLKGVRAAFTRAVRDAGRANQSAAKLGMKVCSKG